MAMFSSRMPRKYRRVSIYSDEHKEKLDKLVQEVRRQQGELPEQPYDPTDKFKGQFSKFTPHAQKAKGGRKLAWPVILMLICALVLIWYYLQTGHVYGRH